ncbi:MAG: type 1 pili tip component [Oceanobacter sp.]
MKLDKLLDHWENHFGEQLTTSQYQLPLNVKDAARVEALVEMFPGMTQEQILRDLVNAALNDLAGALPYIAGNQIVSRDEEGFPIYEDVGPTPRFLELTRKHLDTLSADKH